MWPDFEAQELVGFLVQGFVEFFSCREGLGHSPSLELKKTFTAIRKPTVRAFRELGQGLASGAPQAWSLATFLP